MEKIKNRFEIIFNKQFIEKYGKTIFDEKKDIFMNELKSHIRKQNITHFKDLDVNQILIERSFNGNKFNGLINFQNIENPILFDVLYTMVDGVGRENGRTDASTINFFFYKNNLANDLGLTQEKNCIINVDSEIFKMFVINKQLDLNQKLNVKNIDKKTNRKV